MGWTKLHTEMCIALCRFNTTTSEVSVVLCFLDVRYIHILYNIYYIRRMCVCVCIYTVEPLITDTDGEFKFCPL